MPIPPRPIPSSSTRHARPGGSVPRKSLPATHHAHTLDWRVEVALLGDMPPYRTGKSVPGLRSGGVHMVDTKVQVPVPGPVGRQARDEVGLEGLILEGKGKREKRATTATTLGFDFIPNPSITALPDEPATSVPKASLLSVTKAKTPLLSTRSDSPKLLPVAASSTTSLGLSATPSTPGLVPASVSTQNDDDLSDWEHVGINDTPFVADDGGLESDLDEGSEEDVIVLGELELEDELQGADDRRAKRHDLRTSHKAIEPQKVKRTDGVSYAKMASMMGQVAM